MSDTSSTPVRDAAQKLKDEVKGWHGALAAQIVTKPKTAATVGMVLIAMSGWKIFDLVRWFL